MSSISYGMNADSGRYADALFNCTPSCAAVAEVEDDRRPERGRPALQPHRNVQEREMVKTAGGGDDLDRSIHGVARSGVLGPGAVRSGSSLARRAIGLYDKQSI